MINQSTNSLFKLIKELTLGSEFYYVKQKSIASVEEVDGHIVYSHYKRYNSPITDELIKQHINAEITLAISIKGKPISVFEYSGKNVYAFGLLLYKLSQHENIKKIEILDYSSDKITILLDPIEQNIKIIENLLKNISEKIESKLPLSWRVSPNNLRPDNGNLLQLPKEYIELPW